MHEDDITKMTLTHIITDKLRQDIIMNVIPCGSRLTTQAIAKKYNVSIIPVREAFKTLDSEGLLDVSPYKGATVSAIDEHFFKNTYEVIRAIGGLVFEKSIPHWSPQMRENAIKLNEDMIEIASSVEAINKDFHRINSLFHSMFEKFTDNELAFELLERYRRIILLVGFKVPFTSNQRVLEAIEEHKELIAALDTGNLDLCRNAYMKHMLNARRYTLEKVYNANDQ